MTGHATAWEFRVRPGCVEEFEQHYGPNGTWAHLFRRSAGYTGTLLLRDATEPLRYVTIDRWQSAEHCHAFRVQFARAYEELDARCAALTTRETALGELSEIA